MSLDVVQERTVRPAIATTQGWDASSTPTRGPHDDRRRHRPPRLVGEGSWRLRPARQSHHPPYHACRPRGQASARLINPRPASRLPQGFGTPSTDKVSTPVGSMDIACLPSASTQLGDLTLCAVARLAIGLLHIRLSHRLRMLEQALPNALLGPAPDARFGRLGPRAVAPQDAKAGTDEPAQRVQVAQGSYRNPASAHWHSPSSMRCTSTPRSPYDVHTTMMTQAGHGAKPCRGHLRKLVHGP